MERKEKTEMNEETTTIIKVFLAILVSILIIISLIWGMSAIYKIYNVWGSAKEGEAEKAQADWNRQITVIEANAKKEAAISLAQAEVERAKGVAEANKIIGESISENYLRYLYVQGLQTNQMQTIYVPTNGILPVLDISPKIPKS